MLFLKKEYAIFFIWMIKNFISILEELLDVFESSLP